MTIRDANLLIYATDTESSHHGASLRWLEDILSVSETLGFAWAALITYVRVCTNPRVFANPMTVAEVLGYVDGWLAQPNATIVHETRRHAAVLRDLLVPVGVTGDLTPDAHLAALAVEHDTTLHSADSDFARFPAVRWFKPMQ